MHFAASEGHRGALGWLESYGADREITDSDGKTAQQVLETRK